MFLAPFPGGGRVSGFNWEPLQGLMLGVAQEHLWEVEWIQRERRSTVTRGPERWRQGVGGTVCG